jgi:BirA family transcriptional regulator, biotin operon repressor / biotin---[acetyl-CoA-carboxylase] ligase
VELREFRAELPSTQAEAVRRAREGAPEGTRVVAGQQSDGRGRESHSWSSPPGNLYLSLILRAPHARRSMLPLAVGARLRTALAERYDVATVLKWPNDLLVLGPGVPRKLVGILVDAVASPSLGTATVVGVGVNVAAPRSAYPASLRDRTVSLAELTPRPPSVDEVEELTVSAVRSAGKALDTPDSAAEVLQECRSALHGVGRRARVDDAVAGVIRGVGDEGELWLDTPSGTIAVRAGTLVMEET